MGLTLAAAARLFVDPVLALVFPTSCAACREPMDHPRSGPLCDGCWGSLPRHGGGVCGCGVPLLSPDTAARGIITAMNVAIMTDIRICTR